MPVTDSSFGDYCKMTCPGGSEQGECPCACPRDCVYSKTEQVKARARMLAEMRRVLIDKDWSCS